MDGDELVRSVAQARAVGATRVASDEGLSAIEQIKAKTD